MCGLAGVLSFSQRYRLTPAGVTNLAKGLSDDLAHRGPDGAGVWTRSTGDEKGTRPEDPQVVLIHRRLAVIDPDPRSDQPFVSHDNRIALVFNGEIFNFRALREALSPREWRTDGDTEVLLAAYETWGEACVERLEGMFAFAIVDRRDPDATRLVLARDPMGEKPLYVAVQQEDQRVLAVAFSSELAPLRRVPWVDLSVSSPALQHYFAWGYIPGRHSIHAGVAKLLPGHVETITPASRMVRRYFDAGGRHELDGDDRWAGKVSLTRTLVRRAVAKRLVSDVPIGCLLSGGIDSSVVALCMARALKSQGRQLETFSIGFEDARYDETAYAAEVAKSLEARHHAFHVKADAVDLLPRLARVFGEPFADSSAIATHYLCQQTRGHVTVALGGDGGDELFGGYDRYRMMGIASTVDRFPLGLRSLVASAARRMSPGHPKSIRSRLRRAAESIDRPTAGRYGGYLRIFTQPQMSAMYGPGQVPREDPGRVGGLWFEAYLQIMNDAVAAAGALDRVTYLPGDLLVKLDRSSMLHALEVRSPFMDKDLVRFAAGLSRHELLGGGSWRTTSKRLLRDAFAMDLPARVFQRRKMGFAVPIGDWFRGRLAGMLQETLFARDSYLTRNFDPYPVRLMLEAHQNRQADHSHRLYALLMLELWWQDAKADMLAPRSLVSLENAA